MNERANPFQVNGRWYFTAGPFATSKEALRALLQIMGWASDRRISAARHKKRKAKPRTNKKPHPKPRLVKG